MATGIVGGIQRLARGVGIEITRRKIELDSPLMQWLRRFRVEFVIDAGANRGQSCALFRSHGFRGKIVAIEPLKEPYEELERLAKRDGNILALNIALGEARGRSDINISGGDAVASSFREMTNNVIVNAPEQRVVGRQQVEVFTLDEVMRTYCPPDGLAFLKLDVQGCEKDVLSGASSALDRVVGIKVEMSLVENYVGETLIGEMLDYLYNIGFRMADVLPVWRDLEQVEVFQVDGIFFRELTWEGLRAVGRAV